MHVRLAQLPDAGALGALHVASWKLTYRGLIADDYLDRLDPGERGRGWAARLTAPTPGRATWVGEVNEQVIGFVSCGPSRDDGAAPEVGELYGIYLDPPQVGSGHGRRLFEACVVDLRQRGFRQMTLWVLRGNEGAEGFYRHMGLTPDGATKLVTREGVEFDEYRLAMAL